jgi:hypothetical protein
MDSAPKDLFILAGGVWIVAIVGLFLLGFFGAREPVHRVDPDQSREGKDMWET